MSYANLTLVYTSSDTLIHRAITMLSKPPPLCYCQAGGGYSFRENAVHIRDSEFIKNVVQLRLQLTQKEFEDCFWQCDPTKMELVMKNVFEKYTFPSTFKSFNVHNDRNYKKLLNDLDRPYKMAIYNEINWLKNQEDGILERNRWIEYKRLHPVLEGQRYGGKDGSIVVVERVLDDIVYLQHGLRISLYEFMCNYPVG